ncbi:MAG: hypothetical protein PHY48_00710 [Candidatus Cloacimonetes bacterium]|nr:hypothetical protein [Candidatus Cloacimonadota bacterium]
MKTPDGSPETLSVSSIKPQPQRKLLRLHGFDYSCTAAYFITICSYQKQHIWGKVVNGEMHTNQFGKLVAEEWLRSANLRDNIGLDAFVVMPNHVHGIVQIMANQQDIVGEPSVIPAQAGI